ncbi:MAG TPA: PH domain-containing protein, partial [Microlunatus sp.]|nr:PH domain-containing protein [Microlunatus sp.]
MTEPSQDHDQVAAPTQELAPVVEGAPAVKQTERPHPLTPFIRGWIVLVAIVVYGARELIPDSPGDTGFVLPELRFLLAAIAAVVLLAAVVGFVSWYFTRFVIDDEELRVETGAIFKSSKKVPFERLQSVDIIQPFAARIFGLVELRLEVGSGDNAIKLRYLQRDKAARLRDYLLVRAHGEQSSIDSAEHGADTSVFTDLSRSDRPLVTVDPLMLIGSFLLSSEFLITVALTLGAVVVTSVFGVIVYALPGLLPAVIGLVSLVGRRVIAMFNFTLADSSRGLRITRGLTALTSQSVPLDRIQGVAVSQPLLWRRLGWFRVDVDILGYGSSDGENNEDNATSVLLPVARRDQLRVALDRVLPGVDLEAIELHPSPRRARWLSWYNFWTLRYGFDDRVLITEHGWLNHRRDIVPHAKSQSVRIEQGPIQRRLRLADVHVDTPKGPVNAVARQLDTAVARELALTQLDRARAARAADRRRRQTNGTSGVADPRGELAVLDRFRISPDALLGAGSESRVFALDDERVLRIQAPGAGPEVTAQRQALSTLWADVDLGFAVPLLLDAGEFAGRRYTVERRIPGEPLSTYLASGPDRAARRTTLERYLTAAMDLQRLPVPVAGFARLIGPDAPRQYGSLADLLAAQLQRTVGPVRSRLEADLPDLAERWQRLFDDLSQRQGWPALVHGDYFPGNVLAAVQPDGTAVITGVVDFSPHTIAADPMMDVAGAIAFLGLEPGADPADEEWLTELATARLG